MIIECINCKKKFTVNSTLIPKSGRKIKCGSCDHIWFFIPGDRNVNQVDNQFSTNKTNKITKDIIIEKDEPKKKTTTNQDKKVKSKKFKFSSVLSLLIVVIITFISFIIIIDTFEAQLNTIFPNIELVMFNLYETLNDIFLFLKDLIF